MRRWHAERNLMLRRWRQELANHSRDYPRCFLAPPGDAAGVGCHCANGIGTMRKHRPFGCERPRCGLCKLEKHLPKARNAVRRNAIGFDVDACA